MDDTVQNYVNFHSAEEGCGGRIDVVTGPTCRRRWPEHVKAEMVRRLHTRSDLSMFTTAKSSSCAQTCAGAVMASSSLAGRKTSSVAPLSLMRMPAKSSLGAL